MRMRRSVAVVGTLPVLTILVAMVGLLFVFWGFKRSVETEFPVATPIFYFFEESDTELSNNEPLCPYDELIRKYASMHGLDWRLIAAMIAIESQFDTYCLANDNGMGLMQLMPNTAEEMRCAYPFDPEENISTGVKYFRMLYDRIEGELSESERLRFALAAYNGGYGHLLDARKLARSMQLSTSKWKGNVERAYLLLEREDYYQKSRHGYCKAKLIVRHVDRVMEQYSKYQQLYPEVASAKMIF